VEISLENRQSTMQEEYHFENSIKIEDIKMNEDMETERKILDHNTINVKKESPITQYA
jgi:hypothetical protein